MKNMWIFCVHIKQYEQPIDFKKLYWGAVCYTVVSLVAVSKALLRLPQKTSGSCDDAILSAGKLILTYKVI